MMPYRVDGGQPPGRTRSHRIRPREGRDAMHWAEPTLQASPGPRPDHRLDGPAAQAGVGETSASFPLFA